MTKLQGTLLGRQGEGLDVSRQPKIPASGPFLGSNSLAKSIPLWLNPQSESLKSMTMAKGYV